MKKYLQDEVIHKGTIPLSREWQNEILIQTSLMKQINHLINNGKIIIHFIEPIFNHEEMFHDITEIESIEEKDGKIIFNVYPNQD